MSEAAGRGRPLRAPPGAPLSRTVAVAALSAFVATGLTAALLRNFGGFSAEAVVAPTSPLAEPRLQRDVAILADVSSGVEPGHGESCGALATLAERALGLDGVGSRSRIQLYQTGDGKGEDLLAVGEALRALPRPADRGANLKYSTLVRAAVRGFERNCVASLRPIDLSPIYRSISALAGKMINQWGCGADHPCTLQVHSDLQERHDGAIRAALTAKPKDMKAKLDKLPPVVALTGIEVFVCGLGATTDALSDIERANLDAVWTRLLPGATLVDTCD